MTPEERTTFVFRSRSYWQSYNLMINIHRRIHRFTAMLFAIVWLTLSGASAVAQEVAQETATTGPVAIIAHKDTDIENLSLFELRNIFLANQQFWPDRTRIILLVRAPKSKERDFILNTIYEMDEAQFRQYWIAKMFRAEIPRGPKVVFSTGMMLELVIAIPGSISFVSIDEVTDAVKVVKVDGMLPTDPGYPLK
jgi:ABC-type phosphate transport system substrate-binding protein